MIELGTTEKLVMYLLLKKEWMSTKEILELLGKINKTEVAVRATLFRLRKKKLIKDSSKGRETLFSIAPAGQEVISGYLKRISRAKKEWNGKWLIFSFNIPEKKRKLRNNLRNELIFLGFGRLHTNLWICPYDIRNDCNKIIKDLEENNLNKFETLKDIINTEIIKNKEFKSDFNNSLKTPIRKVSLVKNSNIEEYNSMLDKYNSKVFEKTSSIVNSN